MSGDPRRPRPRAPAWRAVPALLALVAALLGCGCSACPPGWAEQLPDEDGFVYAVGSAGEVFVEADALALALTRAARCVADDLELDVERRLSVVSADGRLFVEAEGERGPLADLDALELVDLRRCDDGRTWVLVRLARP